MTCFLFCLETELSRAPLVVIPVDPDELYISGPVGPGIPEVHDNRWKIFRTKKESFGSLSFVPKAANIQED